MLSPPPVEAENAPPEAPPVGCRVLVVDDNVPAARLVARLVEKLGCQTTTAYDGPAALDAADACQPDLILLDIGLPKLDGYEVARRLRSRPECRQTLLVALTGYGTEEDRRNSAAAGFDDHLVKPVGLDTLQKVLAHPRLRAAAERPPSAPGD